MARPPKIKRTVLKAQNLSVTLHDQEILRSLDFEITRGDIVAIIGPNGAGKTTLIRAIMGLIPLSAGEISLLNNKPKDVREKIGYVPQRFFVDDALPITVREFLSLTHTKKGGRGMKRALKEVGMYGSEDQQLSQLSGGQLQRILIARALLGKPNLLILDEPVSNIDQAGSRSIYEHLDEIRKKHDVTILIVSHELSVVNAYADKVVGINKELVCFGSPKEVVHQKTFTEMYGEHATPHHHH